MGSSNRSFTERLGQGVSTLLNNLGTLISNRLGATPTPPNPTFPSQPRLVTFAQPVTRSEDLLNLIFEFINLKVEPGSGQTAAQLVKADPTKQAHIIVHFPPQNLAEEAFFEFDPAFKVRNPQGVPADPDQNQQTSAQPGPGGVQTLIAGRSRLVFKIPDQPFKLAYRLEAILESLSHFELEVAATALPPEISRRPALPGSFAALLNPPLSPDISRLGSLNPSFGGGLSGAGSLQSSLASQLNMAQQTSQEIAQKLRANRGISPSLDLDKTKLFNNAANRIGQILGGLVQKPALSLPTNQQTALELPFRLLLSPHSLSGWAHRISPFSGTPPADSPPPVNPEPGSQVRWTELWHTRLGVRQDSGVINDQPGSLNTVRAIWTRDNDFKPTDPLNPPLHSNLPFRMSLDSSDRHQLVHLSSNFLLTIPAQGGQAQLTYRPLPIPVERLMLSTLGAWVNLRGAWNPPNGLAVEEWRQRGTQGRDHFVRVVYKGYLFPFGHRASLIKVTERKFEHSLNGNPALLRQRMFLVVREPDQSFPETSLKSRDGNFFHLQMPFRRVRLTTLVTPNLDPPENSDFSLSLGNNPNSERTGQSVFWPQVNHSDFQFHLIGEDRDGQLVEFTAPLLFVSTERSFATNPILLTSIKIDYERNGPASRRERPLNHQRLAFTQSRKLGDTTFETTEMVLGVEIPDQATFNQMDSDSPRFYPVIREASLSVPALKHLAGVGQANKFTFSSVYLKNGLGGSQNPGEVFLELSSSQTLPLSFNQQGDRSGGLIKPNMQVKGLSRLTGPVAGQSGLDKITGGKFDPADFFGGSDAKLFGVINLFELIKAASLPDLTNIPAFKTESLTSVQVLLEDLAGLLSDLGALNAGGGLSQGAVTAVSNLMNSVGTLQSEAANLVAALPDLPDAAAQSRVQNALADFKTQLGAFNNSLKMLPASDTVKSLQKKVADFNSDLADLNQYTQHLLSTLQIPDEIKASFGWQPELHDWPTEGGALFVASDGDAMASVLISASVRAQTNFKTAPQVDINCVMRDFKLNLIGNFESFIIIHFKKLQFQSGGGKKADVDVDLGQVEFVGVLSFVETLKSLIPLNGFSDPPDLQVTKKGILSSYSLSLPNIGFGVFSLENLSLSAKLTIPFFTDPLSFRFNFCERHSPFLLTVAFFGGGGFFGLTVDPGGVQILEAAFEFGASISIDFGIASGGVHVLGGIYYKMERASGKFRASLTGYFRMGGEVSVLGIVSVSVELYLGLTYEFSSGKCTGRATLTLEVHIIFFSISFEVSVERKFAGSNGDPSFAQLMAPYPDPFDPGVTVDPWEEYCQAFA